MGLFSSSKSDSKSTSVGSEFGFGDTAIDSVDSLVSNTDIGATAGESAAINTGSGISAVARDNVFAFNPLGPSVNFGDARADGSTFDLSSDESVTLGAGASLVIDNSAPSESALAIARESLTNSFAFADDLTALFSDSVGTIANNAQATLADLTNRIFSQPDAGVSVSVTSPPVTFNAPSDTAEDADADEKRQIVLLVVVAVAAWFIWKRMK